MKSAWVKIERSEFAEAETSQGKRNFGSTHYLSPYELPEAVRAYVDENSMVVVVFRYIPIDEKTKIKPLEGGSGIFFEIGKITRRIYKIAVPLELLKNSSKTTGTDTKPLEAAIDNLISSLRPTIQNERNKEAYSANKNILHHYSDQLKSEIAMGQW